MEAADDDLNRAGVDSGPHSVDRYVWGWQTSPLALLRDAVPIGSTADAVEGSYCWFNG
jgi:hypothetical protein